MPKQENANYHPSLLESVRNTEKAVPGRQAGSGGRFGKRGARVPGVLARLRIARFRRTLRHGFWVGSIPGRPSLLPAGPSVGQGAGRGRICRHDRRRSGDYGSRQPRGQGGRRLYHRLQHRPAPRTEAQPVPGPVCRVRSFLRPQSDAGQVLVRVRRHAGRIRHAGRGFRGPDVDPVRQDRAVSRGRDGAPVLDRSARLRREIAAGRTDHRPRRTWNCFMPRIPSTKRWIIFAGEFPRTWPRSAAARLRKSPTQLRSTKDSRRHRT